MSSDRSPSSGYYFLMPKVFRPTFAAAALLLITCRHGDSDDQVGETLSVNSNTSAGTMSDTTSVGTENAESDTESECLIECGVGAFCDSLVSNCFCPPGFFGDPWQACIPHADLCYEAASSVGHSVCRHGVHDPATWTTLSLGGTLNRQDVRRVGKYLVPSGPAARLPTVFSDANEYRLHLCLMGLGFATRFPELENGTNRPAYVNLLFYRKHREFFGGSIYQFESVDGQAPQWGYTIEHAHDELELLTIAETYHVHRHLNDRFALGPLQYVPTGELQEMQARGWPDTPFPVYWAASNTVSYEPYTMGRSYGRVRLVRAAEVDTGKVDFGWQDILVFDDIPQQLEGVFAAAVTGGRQDLLSHLNVLSAQRRTPNLYVKDAWEQFAPFDGQLVRLQTRENYYELQQANLQEAEGHWATHRPKVEVKVLPDPNHDALPRLGTLAAETSEERTQNLARIGAKASGLNTLFRLIDAGLQVKGLAIPFRYQLDFMRSSTWLAEIAAGQTMLMSYADTIEMWRNDPEFISNASLRRIRLNALRKHMREHGQVDPTLVAAVRDAIIAEFGSASTMVRFRSSSNAEDSLEFNGAGLYDSTNACAADSADSGNLEIGSSLCDPQKNRRSIERALLKVWASLWNLGAYEEREYHQIDHSQVGMAVLISTRFPDERANGVAVTGNPTQLKDERYTINVQLGDVDVVQPTPGVTAELNYLTMNAGMVESIERIRASSLVPEGSFILSDAHLHHLGTVLADIENRYPQDIMDHLHENVLLDLEFKIDVSGKLRIKQIRPFLRNTFVPTSLRCDKLDETNQQ